MTTIQQKPGGWLVLPSYRGAEPKLVRAASINAVLVISSVECTVTCGAFEWRVPCAQADVVDAILAAEREPAPAVTVQGGVMRSAVAPEPVAVPVPPAAIPAEKPRGFFDKGKKR